MYTSDLRVARDYPRSHQIAEHVVLEARIEVLKGASKFEGRSSLHTWMCTLII
jgi:RNA polymerase sigma-70 factor (ECF subfamily)